VKANPNTVVFQKTDVAKWAELKNLIKVSEVNFGDVPDVYVAGAGVFEPVSAAAASINPLNGVVVKTARILTDLMNSHGQTSGTTTKMNATLTWTSMSTIP
jgi:hypothetical protein